MILLKVHELAVNKESISFQTDMKLADLCLSNTRSYFKNNGFDVTDIKLINKDTCKQFRANQRNGSENYVLNFYSTGRIVINSKCLEELLESRIPGLENLYEITFKIKGAKSIKSKDTSTTAVKESTTKDSNDLDNTSSINLETYKEPSQTPSDTTSEKSKISPPKKTTPEKEITARHIVTNQSRQQSIFNNKIETEQTWLTEELNQLQVHVQLLKHNMKGDDIKQEFKMLIRKEVATLKETLLETFESKQKKLQKEIDTLKKENSELRVHIENIICSKQQKDISNNQDKQNDEIQFLLESITERQELLRSSANLKNNSFQIRLKTLKVH